MKYLINLKSHEQNTPLFNHLVIAFCKKEKHIHCITQTTKTKKIILSMYVSLPFDNNVAFLLMIGNNAYYYARFHTSGFNGVASYNYQTKKSLDVSFPIECEIQPTDKIIIKSAYPDTRFSSQPISKEKIINDNGYGNNNNYTIVVNNVEYNQTNKIVLSIEEDIYTIRLKYKEGGDDYKC